MHSLHVFIAEINVELMCQILVVMVELTCFVNRTASNIRSLIILFFTLMDALHTFFMIILLFFINPTLGAFSFGRAHCVHPEREQKSSSF